VRFSCFHSYFLFADSSSSICWQCCVCCIFPCIFIFMVIFSSETRERETGEFPPPPLSRVQGCSNLGGNYDSFLFFFIPRKKNMENSFSFLILVFFFFLFLADCVNRRRRFESWRRETRPTSSCSWHGRFPLFKRGRR
jgi:hypothetical protein